MIYILNILLKNRVYSLFCYYSYPKKKKEIYRLFSSLFIHFGLFTHLIPNIIGFISVFSVLSLYISSWKILILFCLGFVPRMLQYFDDMQEYRKEKLLGAHNKINTIYGGSSLSIYLMIGVFIILFFFLPKPDNFYFYRVDVILSVTYFIIGNLDITSIYNKETKRKKLFISYSFRGGVHFVSLVVGILIAFILSFTSFFSL